jgi:DNA replication protein DnaC
MGIRSEGLLLIGPSRSGKTRAVWALLKRLHFQEERKIVALGPKDLKAAVANEWRDRDDDEPDLTSRLRHAGLLFLDDLDTIKFTEAVEETVYDTFEYRLAHGRPVILTLNQSGPELAGRMSTEARGEKIIGRMRESCRVINFG